MFFLFPAEILWSVPKSLRITARCHGAIMQILPPVLERELRVASRRRGTFWSRVAVAGMGTIVAAWLPVSVGGLTGFVALLYQEDG